MEKCKITFYPINKDMEVPVGTALKKAMNDAGLDSIFPVEAGEGVVNAGYE